MLDPVDEPVRHAEFAVTDAMGCAVVSGGADPFGSAACRATTELHRDDFTVSWQTMLARGIAVVGPSIKVDLDVQVVRKG
ncbi:hypothetical protein GCM10023086_04830 [Streptomyces venetus]|uniref:YceI family protein n=1 Tax=Streptomyces venetus TaxID=1701086 RepID=A0ABP8F371_9ACTN